MNDLHTTESTTTAKTAVIKTLAIVGFFATIGLGVWLLVQGARLAPGTFSSLASIAESIQSYRPVTDLTVATEKSIVNSGESFKVTWTDMKRAGSYRFTYACTEGISVDVRGESDMVTVPCTETLTLPENVQGLFLSIRSTGQRFIEVPFTIAFIAKDGKTTVERDATVTVVNATIAQKDATSTKETSEVPVKPEPKPVTETPSTPRTPSVPPTTYSQPKETELSFIPQSYENGFTDLKVTFLGIGTMSGDTFVPTATLDNDKRGAVKFEIKNIGTKTSGTWTFKTVLPSGVTYTSEPQVGLKPNEHATFTLGFTLEEKVTAKSAKIETTVFTKNDTNGKNDSFSWSVKVTD